MASDSNASMQAMQPMQLDIFDHSHDTMLRNDVVHAIEQRDPIAAKSAWLTFSLEFPRDESLSPLAVLVEAIERGAGATFLDHDRLRQAHDVLSHATEPAALRMLGQAAGAAWLAPLWQELARRSAPLAFLPERSEDHAAPLWLLGGDWPAAIAAVAGIASWRRIPAPLAWMAEAHYRAGGLETAFALLAELAWLSPERFDALTRRIADPSLEKLRKKFDADFEGDGELADLVWFPAWVLTEQPGLARLLGETQPSLHHAPEQALRLLLELLRLERQGRHHEMVQRRKLLRDLQPCLYAAYMATR